MSVAVIMQRIADASPHFKARMAGALYLLSVVTATFAQVFLRRRLNVAWGLVAISAMVVVTLILYVIFFDRRKSLQPYRCRGGINLDFSHSVLWR